MTDFTVTTCFCRFLHHTPTLHLAVPDPSSWKSASGTAAGSESAHLLSRPMHVAPSFLFFMQEAFAAACCASAWCSCQAQGIISASVHDGKARAAQRCGDRSECASGTHNASPLLGGEVVNIFDRHPCRQALGMGLQPKGQDLKHGPPRCRQEKIDSSSIPHNKKKKTFRTATATAPRQPQRRLYKALVRRRRKSEGCAMGSRACWRCVRWGF